MSNLNITIIQTNLSWEDKAANLKLLEAKINTIEAHTEVVVLPEMFTTGFSMRPQLLAETMDGATISWMRRIATSRRIIITGSVIIKEDEKFYNRLVWMLPNGDYGFYNKRHLFAYSGEHEHYSPGNKRLIASVKGWKINLQICYDLRFPVWARQNPAAATEAGPEYDVLLYVANWPEKRSHAWKTLLCARAIENQCYVVGVNRVGYDGNNMYYSGNSLILNPLGEVLYHMADEEDVFTITLEKQELQDVRNKFPFWKDGDAFTLNK
jgi:omega-amidase